MSARAKRKYPNLPEKFRTLVKEERVRQNISLREMGLALGIPAATISQLERGDRNFSYSRALQFKDFLDLAYELPEPKPEEAETITRNRKKNPIERDPFFIDLGGELIEVRSYRRLGPIGKAEWVLPNG